MTTNIFLDKLQKPDEQILQSVLGMSYSHWTKIKDFLQKEYGTISEEWKHYGKNLGWTLKVFYKKRNLFFFTAMKDNFNISFVLGDKAVSEVEKSSVSKQLIEELRNARKYMEGRGLQVNVKKASDVKNILTLIKIKVEN